MDADYPEKSRFAEYTFDRMHVDIAEVRAVRFPAGANENSGPSAAPRKAPTRRSSQTAGPVPRPHRGQPVEASQALRGQHLRLPQPGERIPGLSPPHPRRLSPVPARKRQRRGRLLLQGGNP